MPNKDYFHSDRSRREFVFLSHRNVPPSLVVYGALLDIRRLFLGPQELIDSPVCRSSIQSMPYRSFPWPRVDEMVSVDFDRIHTKYIVQCAWLSRDESRRRNAYHLCNDVAHVAERDNEDRSLANYISLLTAKRIGWYRRCVCEESSSSLNAFHRERHEHLWRMESESK